MTKTLHLKTALAFLATATVFWIGSPAGAQAQDNPPPRSNDITRGELASFDQFLDNHREIAEQLRKNPSLVNNSNFVKDHPALQTYLQEHPAVREEISENPRLFMNRENRYDRREDAFDRDAGRRDADDRRSDFDNRPTSDRRDVDERRADNRQNPQTPDDRDTTRGELASFDRFLDSHRETAEQLRKDPSLVNNQQYLQSHPDLQAYLQSHPAVREEITENPNSFMHQENRYDARERYINRSELARLDMFLDSHPQLGEQLRKDPSLVNNQQFVANHPDLETFLHDRPDLANKWTQHPEAFMQREQRYEATENPAMDRPANQQSMRDDRDTTRGQLASFDRFLDSHRETAEQLRRDPSLVNNKQFVENHPALQAYLQEHQGVREEITENPNAFMRQENRYDRQEDAMNRGMRREDTDSFREFLGGHSSISKQLSADPSKARDPEYLRSHPELQEYLKAHPGVQTALTQDAHTAVKSATATGTTGTTATKPATTDSKPPKQ